MVKLLKSLIFPIVLLLISPTAWAQMITRAQYIESYKGMAIRKMKMYGIPASITLAQGILESNSGNSTLARQANNHFGIKCHKGWTGETMYRTDDLPDECFRKYKSAEGSYEDHSLFLRGYSRYAFLFDLEPTDYAAWAKGLKKAGYATAPTYAEMLIRVIDECELYKYDTGIEVEIESPNEGQDEEYGIINEEGKIEKFDSKRVNSSTNTTSKGDNVDKNASGNKTGKTVKNRKTRRTKDQEKADREDEVADDEEPEKKLSGGLALDDNDYAIDMYNARRVYVRNRIKFIKVRRGDTFQSLTKEMHLLPFQLYKYNELGKNTTLKPGQVLYLQPKRNKASINHKAHVAEAGETMYQISQMYGIKIKSLYRLNRMDEGNEVEEGQLVYLRTKKKAL